MHEGVIPVRAFPITAPERGIALIDQHGHELAWIEQLSDLPDELRDNRRSGACEPGVYPRNPAHPLMFRVSLTPSTWQVETDRGKTAFILKGEEDIRRLSFAISADCG